MAEKKERGGRKEGEGVIMIGSERKISREKQMARRFFFRLQIAAENLIRA